MKINIDTTNISIDHYVVPINSVSYFISKQKDSVTYYIRDIATLTGAVLDTTVNGVQMTSDNIKELLSPLFFLDSTQIDQLETKITKVENKLDSVVGSINYLTNVNLKINTSSWVAALNHSIAINSTKPPVSINNSLAITSSGVGGASTGYVIQQLRRQQVVLNQIYTLSFWVKSSIALNLHIEFQGGVGSLNKAVTTEWTFVKNTFTATRSSTTLYLWLNRSGVVYINDPQLEIGSLATDCSDVQDQIDSLLSRITALENK